MGKNRLDSPGASVNLRHCLPDAATKTFLREQPPLQLDLTMERADVVARLESLRETNELAALAFYAYRDLNRTEPEPFLLAALERSPVSIAAMSALDDDGVVAAVTALAAESIYDGPGRLAQPDEVWNYRRGDGVEKALLLANVLRARHPGLGLTVDVTPDSATLHVDTRTYSFASVKNLAVQTWDCGERRE